ncbi:DNA repair protein Rad4-like protein, partial [Leptotrombidium deliense]
MHKTHLLCCVAAGQHMNSTLNTNCTIKALSFSFLVDGVFQIKELTIDSLQNILKWFRDHFRYTENKSKKEESHFSDMLSSAFSLQESSVESVFTYILVCLLRSIETVSIEVRLCYAINPVPLRPKNLILSDKQRERKNATKIKNKEDVVKKGDKVTDTILISSDDEDVIAEPYSKSSGKKQRLRQFWLEVYFPTGKRWVYVDPVNGKVDDVSDIEKHTCNPLLYVFAFDNKNYVSDVTKKYNQKWTEREFRVNRVNEQWLQETLH